MSYRLIVILLSFHIKHISLKAIKDMDYIIRQKSSLEKVLNCEMKPLSTESIYISFNINIKDKNYFLQIKELCI